MIEVIKALLFMSLGGLLVEVFEVHAWRRYQQGRAEGSGQYDGRRR